MSPNEVKAVAAVVTVAAEMKASSVAGVVEAIAAEISAITVIAKAVKVLSSGIK